MVAVKQPEAGVDGAKKLVRRVCRAGTCVRERCQHHPAWLPATPRFRKVPALQGKVQEKKKSPKKKKSTRGPNQERLAWALGRRVRAGTNAALERHTVFLAVITRMMAPTPPTARAWAEEDMSSTCCRGGGGLWMDPRTDGGGGLYLLVPLQQHGAAVVRGSLEAPVDVLHQQVHPRAVQRRHCLLDVAALKTAQHPHRQQLRSLLHTHTEEEMSETRLVCSV